MEIKKIKKLSNGKYQIDFSNGEKLITYDEVILKNNLLYKKELTSEDLNEINKHNDYYAVYNDAIKYLTKKVRCKKEFMKHISKYELSSKQQQKLIKDSEELRLLDDNKFMKAFISDRFFLTSDGPLKIKKSLLAYDIDETLIMEELSKIANEDLVDKATKIVNKRLKSLKGSSYIAKQKLYNDMYNLGYDKATIDECFIEEIDDSNSLMKDFNKYYKEYSKKEKDPNKLKLKIKQKLYQKGYSSYKIDEIISREID